MGAGNAYKADTSAMADTSASLSRISSAIEAAIGIIDNMISSNAGNWTDEAGQAYQTKLTKIKSDLIEAQTQVTGMSGVVGDQGTQTAAAIQAGANRLSV